MFELPVYSLNRVTIVIIIPETYSMTCLSGCVTASECICVHARFNFMELSIMSYVICFF